MADFFIINKKYETYHSRLFKVQIRYTKHKMGNSGRIPHASHLKIAVYRLHSRLTVQIARFYAEIVV